ncbi:hypothetical protein [Deinococcus sp.]|uniref:hypothetical protein n=1 Tax=Deinococcus sp. TaxID=47478 RepID=UPI003B59983A
MTNPKKSDDSATQHGKYGDAPLGKSDEELREEGADTLTNDERMKHESAGEGAVVPMPVPLPSFGGSTPGVAIPVILDPEGDAEKAERNEN